MFTVMLVVCFIDKTCVLVEDTRGPYDTEGECNQRIAEMSSLVPFLVTKPWRIALSTCEAEGELT